MRTQAVILLFMLAAAAAAARNLEKRVEGGHDCPQGEREYHVDVETLDFHGNPESYCGGSLIHQDWVLTAAHCTGQGWRLRVTFGVHAPGPAPPSQEIPLDRQFVYHDGHHCHDIMLLRLDPPVPNLPTINLPPLDHQACIAARPGNRQPVEIGGFGYSGKEWSPVWYNPFRTVKATPTHIQCATMSVLAPCNPPALSYAPIQTPENSLCFQRPHGGPIVDGCEGDSGTAVEHADQIFGVHTLGSDTPCAIPALASDVCFYRAWIHQETGH